jgi:hypothetical protein
MAHSFSFLNLNDLQHDVSVLIQKGARQKISSAGWAP